MGNPTCPSCGHEIYDKGAETCQFCGRSLGRGAVKQVSGGGGRPASRMILSISVLVLVAVGGLVSFLAVQESEMPAKSSSAVLPEPLPEPVQDQPRDNGVCYDSMRVVLDAALELQRGIDSGMLTKEELDRLDAVASGRCPVTDRPYRVDVIGNSVTVTCPDHGPLSGDW